ncbi:MAG: GNAT family protein [Candidatus Neomarinimicrobiota bacterium]
MNKTIFWIDTDRLVLKSHAIENAAICNIWWNDQELLDLDSDDPPTEKAESLAESRRKIQHWIDQSPAANRINYAIHLRENGELIGYGKIARIDTYNHHCSLGIMLGRKDLWRLGYGREVLTAVINYCFDELQLNRIATKIFSFNRRSVDLFEKLGFVHEGTERNKIRKDDRYFDDLNFGLLKSEWATDH